MPLVKLMGLSASAETWFNSQWSVASTSDPRLQMSDCRKSSCVDKSRYRRRISSRTQVLFAGDVASAVGLIVVTIALRLYVRSGVWLALVADIGIGLFCKLQICGGEEVTSRSAFSKHVKCTQRTHRDSRLASPHLFLPLTRPADRPGRHHVTFPGGLQRSKPTRRNSIRHGGRPLD